MADHIFTFKLERRATIAVMGLPYTFRQEMAEYIARWAKCPNLKFEVILSELLSVDEQGAAGAAVINPSVSDVAFNILCKTAVSVLDDRYHPNCVVINFPTPTKPQIQKLISLHVDDDEGVAGYDGDGGGDSYCRRRLLIIECQRRNKFRWRRDVENPDRNILIFNPRYYTGNREPGKWEDVEKAILKHQQQGLDDYFLTQAKFYDVVKKLVVDPFEDLKARDFTEKQGLERRSLFAQSIKHFLTCDNDEYKELRVDDYARWRRHWVEHQASSRGISSEELRVDDYAGWRRHWLEHQASSRGIRSERRLCVPGDCILRFTKNLGAEAVCEACEEKVTCTEGAYYCQLCSLSLHELCAVAQSPTAITAKSTYPHSQVVFNYAIPMVGIPFKESCHACYSCKKDGKQFSKDCDDCIFRTHLKCQLLPTALKHSCDQHHFLSIRLSAWFNVINTIYDCKACGLRGLCSSYCCNICNSEYHLPCVLVMPLHTKEIAHGGHTHSINIKFSCGQREDEYEWCGVCYQDINPETWVYSCQECDFVAHLYCIFPSPLFRWYKSITRSGWAI